MKIVTPGILAVLMTLFLSAPVMAGHHGKTEKNIVETAAAAGEFETLIAAAKAAGLAGALSGEGPLTVFAPTDDAFGALPAGTIETLLKPENKARLARILKFHVVSGRVGSSALADGANLDTLAGAAATISAAEKGFTINGARIVATDIGASNGIVHVIDRVILPPETMSRADAARMIDRAIDRGVPAFNHGNPQKTVAIYTQAAQTLISSAELDGGERMRLTRGIAASRHAGDARESAWQLRYALDDVYASLASSDAGMTARNMNGR